MPPYTIHPALKSDAPSLASILLVAFADDPISTLAFGNVPKSVSLDSHIHHYRQLIEGAEHNGARLFKAVDEGSGFVWMFLSFSSLVFSAAFAFFSPPISPF